MFSDVTNILRRYWIIDDEIPLVIVMGTAIASFFTPNVWLRVVGQSRSGKRVILQIIGGYPDFLALDCLTPASLRGGLKGGGDLSRELETKKLLVIKDLSTVSNMRSESRRELLGLLRVVSDGKMKAMFGSVAGLVTRDYRLGMLVGVVQGTSYSVVDSQLGQRFISVRWQLANSNNIQEKVDACIREYGNNYQEECLIPEVTEAIHEALTFTKETIDTVIENPYSDAMGELASYVATLRGSVLRDHLHYIIGDSQVEQPTTITQQFLAIARGIGLLKGLKTMDYSVYECIIRLARDCIPDRKLRILGHVLQGRKDPDTLNDLLPYSRSVIIRDLEDLRILGIPCSKRDILGSAIINLEKKRQANK